MDIQLITDFLALIAAAGGVFATVGAGLWLLIGQRVAPVQQDVSELKVAVSDLDGKVSDLGGKVSDLKAQSAELNGKFDILLTLLREKPEIESLAGVGASDIPASASKEPAE